MPKSSEDQGEDLFGTSMPGWEKATWALILIYILIVLAVFWFLGWRTLGFPV